MPLTDIIALGFGAFMFLLLLIVAPMTAFWIATTVSIALAVGILVACIRDYKHEKREDE